MTRTACASPSDIVEAIKSPTKRGLRAIVAISNTSLQSFADLIQEKMNSNPEIPTRERKNI